MVEDRTLAIGSEISLQTHKNNERDKSYVKKGHLTLRDKNGINPKKR